MTQQIDIREIVQSFSDGALRQAAGPYIGNASSLRAVRHEDGSLRELSDTEREFVSAAQAEFRRRFL